MVIKIYNNTIKKAVKIDSLYRMIYARTKRARAITILFVQREKEN